MSSQTLVCLQKHGVSLPMFVLQDSLCLFVYFLTTHVTQSSQMHQLHLNDAPGDVTGLFDFSALKRIQDENDLCFETCSNIDMKPQLKTKVLQESQSHQTHSYNQTATIFFILIDVISHLTLA